MAKPANVSRVEQNEYGPVFVDADSGFAYRGPEYRPRYDALVASGNKPGWTPLPDGWFQSDVRVQDRARVLPVLRDFANVVTPAFNGAALLITAGLVAWIATRIKKK